MSEKKQLSVFWGKNSLYFVDTVGISANKNFSVSLIEGKQETLKPRIIDTGNLQLTSRIQNALRQHKISALALNLSLPAKDIIFRSFLIPRLHPSEIKNVVDFEARKYLPFDLKTLSYSYFPLPIFENNIKKVQIIFVAIKKSTLDSYINLFEQATLEINLAEPEPISLLRLLYHKNYILEERTVAILTKGKETTNIIIATQRIPCFVREIQTSDSAIFSPSQNEKQDEEQTNDKDLQLTRLINETRISIDYYRRQNNQTNIDQLILISSNKEEELIEKLQSNFNYEFISVNPQTLLQNESVKDIEYLNAYGSCLFEQVETPTDFLLNANKHYSKMKSITSLKKITEVYQSILITALLSIAIIVGVFFSSQYSISNPKKEIEIISNKLGAIKDASTSRLQEKNNELELKLNKFKEIRQKSYIALFLTIIPLEFPKGIWLNTLDIYYPKDASIVNADGSIEALRNEVLYKPRIELSGYAYLKNPKEQFKVVSKLINNLRKNEILSEIFSNIELKTIKSQKADNQYDTTYFKINFE